LKGLNYAKSQRIQESKKANYIGDNIDAIRAGEANYDYTIPIFVLVICGVISIFLSFLLKKADREQGYGLELPSSAIAPNKEVKE
jgi:hypothetical protein